MSGTGPRAVAVPIFPCALLFILHLQDGCGEKYSWSQSVKRVQPEMRVPSTVVHTHARETGGSCQTPGPRECGGKMAAVS